MRQRILFVEDEASIFEPLSFLLEQQGFEVKVSQDGNEALQVFESFRPHLVLLDVMLPELSGTEVCRKIRQHSQTPIIMLTARNSEIDKVVGLELGADDYVTKPYLARELLARINSVLRRSQMSAAAMWEDADQLIEISEIKLDLSRHTVTVRGEEVDLPLKEFDLLEYLMSNAGHVLTRGQLLNRVWGADYYGDTKTLDVHIKRLRSRIEVDPSTPRLITTIRGVGYRFN